LFARNNLIGLEQRSSDSQSVRQVYYKVNKIKTSQSLFFN